MNYPTRIYYTEADKALMWERWQQGESLNAIARHFGRSHASIQGLLARTGGIRPPPRRRSRLALGRAPSTVSRELRRNGGRGCYRTSQAEQAAWDRGQRPKPCKLAANRPLACIVARQLRRRWSPWQIAGWLKRTYPADESLQVSHETIYRTLFIQARGALHQRQNAATASKGRFRPEAAVRKAARISPPMTNYATV